MKKSLVIWAGFVSILGFIFILHAQEMATPVGSGMISSGVNAMSDVEVLLQAVEMTPTVSADSMPRAGTFWSAQHAPGTAQPWPPLPSNARGSAVWNLGDNVFLLNDLDVNYSASSSSLQMSASMSLGLIPPGFGGGTNGAGFYSDSFNYHHPTNGLWLEITAMSNTTACLTFHPATNAISDVYDLLYTTNLSSPISWQWVLRTDPGITNLVVPNATDALGVYALGQPNDGTANGSLGTNFWLAFPTMAPDSATNRNLWLYISSPTGSSGSVTVPGLHVTNTFAVAAGAVTNISITNAALLGGWQGSGYNSYPGPATEDHGIHVVTTGLVSVYGLYFEPYASTAFTCYPTPLLGTNYCIMAFTDDAYDSQLAIVATEDNTLVFITGGPAAALHEPDSNPFTLQRGQTFQTQDNGAPIGSDYSYGDVTGTWITSDKPIAVFAGSSGAAVPDASTSAINPLVQEQMPVETWGRQMLALSFAGRTNGDTYRILAAYSNTVVTVSGTLITSVDEDSNWYGPWIVTKTNETIVINLDAGRWHDIIIDGPAQFQANEPIQVAHFANGNEFDRVADANAKTDPCELLLPPTGHYFETNIVFVPSYNTNSTGDFDENYLNLIVPQSATNSTFVDGSLVAVTNFVTIITNGFYGARIPVTNGTHRVTSSQPVAVEIYGWGVQDAYGYFGGIVK